MRLKALCRGLLAVAALLALAGGAFAQTMFYNEVVKDGRIYVFASGQRFDMFEKSKGAEIGVAITRPGYGPNGETVVFDSEDAINLYNYKHGLPGEYFPKPKEVPKSPYPAGKFSGLMFGDYYIYDKWHQDTISATNTNNVQNQQGFWLRRASTSPTTSRSARSSRPASASRRTATASSRPGQPEPVREGRLPEVDVRRQAAADPRHPAQPHLRLARGLLGPAPHREDARGPVPPRLLA